MISREASSQPDVSAPSTPTPAVYNSTPPPNRKRKHAAISGVAATAKAASPAPSDLGFPVSQPTEAREVIAADVNTSASRPRLTVSRGPVFVPISEGSIYHSTEQIALNRLRFRYVHAGLAEPGSKIPYRTIESRPAGYVRVNWEDRSPFLKVTTDGLGLCGERGFRSARLNVPVREGAWYMEIKVVHGGGDRFSDSTYREGAHVRLGWGRREARLDGPVGLDGYSYGYGDKTGHKVTLSRPRPYGQSFGTGDVIGMYISLPPKRKPKSNDAYDPAHIKRERIAIDFKGQEYFEIVDYPQSKEMIALMESANNKSKATASLPSSTKKSATVKNVPERGRGSKLVPEPAPMQPLPVLRESHVAFFVNGKSQGIAFQDIYDYLQLRVGPSARKDRSKRRTREGILEHTENHFDDGWLGYYPFISLFNGARVHINSGPNFEFPPPTDIEGALAGHPDSVESKTRAWRPLCERYAEFMEEQWALDAQEEADAQAQTKRQNQPQAAKTRPAEPQQTRPQPHPQLEPHMAPQEVKPQPQPQPPPQVQTSEAVSEADAKVAARRERKRLMERERRKRKAEETRLAKVEREKLAASTSASESISVPLGSHLDAIPGVFTEHQSPRDQEQSPVPAVDSYVDLDMH